MKNDTSHDVAVVGTGPAGLAAALALAASGAHVIAVGAPPGRRDTRTAALFAGSIKLLENIGIGDVCRSAGEPIIAIRIIDDMGGLLRAPEVTFTATEAGLERFGYNVPNADLVEALRQRAGALPNLTLIDAGVAQRPGRRGKPRSCSSMMGARFCRQAASSAPTAASPCAGRRRRSGSRPGPTSRAP